MVANVTEPIWTRLQRVSRDRPVRLGRYDVVGRLGRGGMGAVYDAVDTERGTRVALKTLRVLDHDGVLQLKREFRSVADISHPGLAPVYELAQDQGLWFFTMECIEGVSFRRWARPDAPVEAEGDLPLTRSLPELPTLDSDQLARLKPSPRISTPASPAGRTPQELRSGLAEIVRALLALHDSGVRHGDIKPANVLVQSDGRVVLVDFGLTRGVGEPAGRGPAAGTPAYMAPEELSGLGGGPAADWYGVGIMLYEALTGQQPFPGQSLLDLYLKKTHHHPATPRELVPEVPEDLSDICMRLLEPNPAARPEGRELLAWFTGEGSAGAQSAEGRRVSAFVGRDRELLLLEHAYTRASQGQPVVVHAHGPSGIGKSAMSRSFLRGAADLGGARVLKGRCYERETVPYKAFDGILDDLAQWLATLSDEDLFWVLPANAGALLQVFPALNVVPSLFERAASDQEVQDPMQLRRRAWAALTSLLGGVASISPLVLYIDDLQWADSDSAGLLTHLLQEGAGSRLLIIASYRPREAAENKAIEGYFEGEARESVELVDLPVRPLPPDDAEQLARLCLQRTGRPFSDASVATIVRESGGVPFFIEELARYSGGADSGRGSLDEMVAARVATLPRDQRAVIETVAVADTPTAQAVIFEAAGIAEDRLPELLALRSAHFVTMTGPGADDQVSCYHDRIRESVLGTLTVEARAERHAALGRALARRHETHAPGPWLYDVVRHLNAAPHLLSGAHERLGAARWNLQAGRLARKAAAYPLAAGYLRAGVALLTEGDWAEEYELALALHGELAEAAYLSAEFDTVEACVDEVLTHATALLDAVKAYETRILAFKAQNKLLEAVATGIEVLAKLGITFPEEPTPEDTQRELAATMRLLEGRSTDELLNLPEMTDPKMIAAERILASVNSSVYWARAELFPFMVFASLRIAVEHGNTAISSFGYSIYGVLLSGAVGDVETARSFGELGLKLVERFDAREWYAQLITPHYALIVPWIQHLRDTMEPLAESVRVGYETGAIEYALINANLYCIHGYLMGMELGALEAELRAYGEKMRRARQDTNRQFTAIYRQAVLNLMGRSADPCRLVGEAYDEEEMLPVHLAANDKTASFIVYFNRMILGYLFGRLEEAARDRDEADARLSAILAKVENATYRLYDSLVTLGRRAEGRLTRDETVARVEANQALLEKMAGNAPMNYRHKYLLVEAERLRVLGDPDEAGPVYDEAIALAAEHEFVQEEALACELAGEHHLAWGERERGLELLGRALAAWERWGARAKAAELVGRHRELA